MHQGELDELEREEFFRLKKVQKNKQKVAAKDAAAKAARVSRCGVTWLQLQARPTIDCVLRKAYTTYNTHTS
jgi:hypothetical protein